MSDYIYRVVRREWDTKNEFRETSKKTYQKVGWARNAKSQVENQNHYYADRWPTYQKFEYAVQRAPIGAWDLVS